MTCRDVAELAPAAHASAANKIPATKNRCCDHPSGLSIARQSPDNPGVAISGRQIEARQVAFQPGHLRNPARRKAHLTTTRLANNPVKPECPRTAQLQAL